MKSIIIYSCLWFCFSLSSDAQNFQYNSDSPFGLQVMRPDSSRQAQTIQFYDVDNDGDYDALLTGLFYIENASPLGWRHVHFFVDVQLNEGTRYAPQFTARDSFMHFPFPVGYFFMSPGDLTSDGLPDYVTSADIDFTGMQTVTLQINSGWPTMGPFNATTLNAMGLLNFVPESFFKPELVDLDRDGDLDLMMSGFESAFAEDDGLDIPRFYYARNYGTSSSPNYEGWYSSPYGLEPDTIPEMITSGDIDNDGDVDFLGTLLTIPADSNNQMLVHLNQPDLTGRPVFNTVMKSPFGLPSIHGSTQLMFPDLVDIDGDGDLDLFVFNRTGQSFSLQYYQNELCQTTTHDVALSVCEGGSVDYNGVIYTAPGVYVVQLESSLGCDSSINLTILLEPAVETSIETNICQGESYAVGNEIFTTAGQYVIALTAANGCDSIVQLQLHVDPLAAFALEEFICPGQVYTVGNQSFDESGDFTITLTAANGCDSLVYLTLHVNDVDPTVILIDHTLIAQQLDATYQWYDCKSGQNIPGEIFQEFVPTVTGSYGVHIVSAAGCIGESICTTVVVTSAIKDLKNDQFKVYPNPARDHLYIIHKGAKEISALALYNTSGQLIGQFIPDGNHAIDVSDVGAGVYFMKVNADGVVGYVRVVIVGRFD